MVAIVTVVVGAPTKELLHQMFTSSDAHLLARTLILYPPTLPQPSPFPSAYLPPNIPPNRLLEIDAQLMALNKPRSSIST